MDALGVAMLLFPNTPNPPSKFSLINVTLSVVVFAESAMMLSSPQTSGFEVVNDILDTGFT